jgi:hypothetical protein
MRFPYVVPEHPGERQSGDIRIWIDARSLFLGRFKENFCGLGHENSQKCREVRGTDAEDRQRLSFSENVPNFAPGASQKEISRAGTWKCMKAEENVVMPMLRRVRARQSQKLNFPGLTLDPTPE